MTIEKTEKVNLDNVEYTRVYFAESNIFEDIETEMFPAWIDALEHTYL